MLDSITPYFNLYYILTGLCVLVAFPLLRQKQKTLTQTTTLPPPPPSTMPHTVVILGAGFVGVTMAHHLLKHTPADVTDLRIVLVAPNESYYWNVASPRGFLPSDDKINNPKGSPGFGDDKLFFPLAPLFKKYGNKFEQLVGRATSLDPDAQTVEASVGGATQTVAYDTLLIATGSDILGGVPFKNVSTGGTAETKAALKKYRDGIAAASHIVVAGGGMTGTELAGELGHAYAKSKAKKIVLVISEQAPLEVYSAKESVQQQAASQLKGLGVELVTGSKVLSTAERGGKTVLNLGGGRELETDLYIPAFGISFNTQFIPEKLLDLSAAGKRRVKTRSTLQAEGYDNIFVAGDAANLQPPSLKNADDQIQLLSAQLQTYLKSKTGKAPLAEYTASQDLIMVVTVGPGGGTGQFGTWRLFSFLLWVLKSRFLGTDYVGELAAGNRTMTNTKW